MGAVTAAVIGAVGAIGAAKMSADASDKAAGAASKAGNASLALQRQAYETQQANLQPYMQLGTGAIDKITALNNGDYSGFINSPDYQFTLQQGMQGLDRSAAARGSLYSGGHSADLTKYAQGLASTQLGNYRSNLMGLVNLGQNSAAGVGQAAQNYANSSGTLLSSMANATGNAAISSGNAWGDALGGLSGIASRYASSYGTGTTTTAPATGNYGVFSPNVPAWDYGSSYGSLGPSNGSGWNFGS